MLYKSDLEKAITNIDDKLDQGINVTVHVKDHRLIDALTHGLIIGGSFAVGNIIVQAIRNRRIRKKNQKWYSEIKRES